MLSINYYYYYYILLSIISTSGQMLLLQLYAVFMQLCIIKLE